MRARLLVLAELRGPSIGSEASWLRARLSNACRYTGHQLDPAIDDLRN